MGTFTYNSTLTVEFDDRLLLHLQVVISTKLRRDEPFMFSWSKPVTVGGRTSVWIDKHIPIEFDYSANSMPGLNRQWIEDLAQTTHRTAGLQIVPEPGAGVAADPAAAAAKRLEKTAAK